MDILKRGKKMNCTLDIRKLMDIRYQLQEMLEAEATRLYRLARKMEEHGVSIEEVQKCRNEADEFHMCSYPERVLDPFRKWNYAFCCDTKVKHFM